MKAAAAFAMLLFTAGFFCLAEAPQNPDGAELVMAALQGAVLHPPGYPLQAWLGKLWLLAPYGNPAWGYSLLCLTLQSLTAFVFLLVTREYGVRTLFGLIAAGIFFCFPPLFMLGIQPEKYALVLLFASLLLLERFWFVAGLALTQHFGLVIYLPLVLWRYARKDRPNWIGFGLICAGGFLLAQLSLLLLAQFGGWPDWGALQSLPDVVRHTLRSDIGFMGGTKEMGSFSGQQSSLGLLLGQWNWLVLIWGVALVPAIVRLKADKTIAILMASLLLGIASLWFARLPGTTALDKEYLLRYWVMIMPLIALIIGIGLEHASRWQKLFGITALAATLLAVFIHRHDMCLRGSRVFDVYRAALSHSLGRSLGSESRDPVYISSSDVEPFWGVRLADGSLRFPLAGDYPWFLEQKVLVLDHRISSWAGGQLPPSTAAIMNRAFELKIPIVTTTPDVLPVKTSWQNYGLYSESATPGNSVASGELEQVAEAVCAAMIAFGQDTPLQARYGSLELWESLREPFRLLVAERARQKHDAAAAHAEAVYAAMAIGKGGSALRMCESYVRRVRSEQHD